MSFPHRDFDIKTEDGLLLKARTYNIPQGVDLKAKILYVHGFSEHMAAYEHWFPRVAQAGYEVTFFDQRGFGSTAVSEKDYGVTTDALAFSDLDTVYQTCFENYDGPLLMWGHSMGGGITLTYMVRGTYRARFDGYIANSPLIENHPKVTSWKAVLVPFLNRWIPSFRSPVPVNPEWCTNNPELIKSYPNDKLRHNMTSAPLAYAMLTRGPRLLDPEFNKNIIDRPLLISHGTSDYLCRYEASDKFIKEAPLSDKTLRTYPDALHELMHAKEDEAAAHLSDILSWLDSHEKRFNSLHSVPRL